MRSGSPDFILEDHPSLPVVRLLQQLTDEQIAEIYALARDSLLKRPSFQVHAIPFRLTPANLTPP
ncbi:MAG: hypothetical protein IT537_20405 [Hyphomicrobiales bacterium]|nr:hypothetical protein [Hyphomicrobiales bacterium]